jgi:hypothetical protein
MDIVLAMRKGFLNFLLMTVAVVAFGLMVLASTCLAQPQHRLSSDQVNSLKKFLQNYVGNSDDDSDLPPNSAHFMIRHPDRSLARRW